MTRDVLLTLSLLLGAALAARFLASLLRVPEILVLVLVRRPVRAVGARRGRRAVRLDRGPAPVHPRGLADPLLRRAQPLAAVLRRVWIGLGMLVVPGVVLTAVITGVAAHLAFDLSWTAALLMGAVLAPTDPAILIPLFVRSRLRPKVAQTVVAESAFNDPTGAVLALALAGRPAQRRRLARTPARDFVGRPGDQHRDRRRRRGAAGGDDLEPARRHLARVVGRRGAGRGHDRLLLARLGRRQRLPRRLPRRADRRQHGAPRARDALARTSASCGSSPSTWPTS